MLIEIMVVFVVLVIEMVPVIAMIVTMIPVMILRQQIWRDNQGRAQG